MSFLPFKSRVEVDVICNIDFFCVLSYFPLLFVFLFNYIQFSSFHSLLNNFYSYLFLNRGNDSDLLCYFFSLWCFNCSKFFMFFIFASSKIEKKFPRTRRPREKTNEKDFIVKLCFLTSSLPRETFFTTPAESLMAYGVELTFRIRSTSISII